jgi:OmpA-OmpF porin, OOP family
MKQLISTILLLAFIVSIVNAQSKGKEVANRAKERTNQRVDQKIDEAIDGSLNKIENGVKGIFKKKEKKVKAAEEEKQATPTSENTTASPEPTNTAPTKAINTQVKSNSKFDFEPGKKVLQYDDFSRLNVGDFPAEYNSNTTGEVINLSNKEGKWLNLSKNGCIVPDYMKKLPENFTLEFEIGINNDPTNNYSGFGLNFTVDKENLLKEMFFNKGNAVVYLHPGAAEASIYVNPLEDGALENNIKMPEWDVRDGANKHFAKISVWRQKGRLRVYVNEDKVVDVPRFFVETKPYSFAFFRSFFGDCEVYLTKIRYAIAGEDLRAKLMNEGKFSTTGITFDTNSDKIKATSKATLDEIAAVLQANTDFRIKIVGHTDNDGDAKANIVLSQKRAAAIKLALVNNYNIDASRLITEGKGENEPLNGNSTAEEKAANRRAEFIKL